MTTAVTSKKQIAAQIYKTLSTENKTRKEIIFEMMEKANLTDKGASTYYANFKSGEWSTEPKKGAVEVQPIKLESIDTLSNFELFEYYNKHATIKLDRFPGREELIGLIKFFVK